MLHLLPYFKLALIQFQPLLVDQHFKLLHLRLYMLITIFLPGFSYLSTSLR